MKKYWAFIVFPFIAILSLILNIVILSNDFIDGTYKGLTEDSKEIQLVFTNNQYFVYDTSNTPSQILDTGIYSPDNLFISFETQKENPMIVTTNIFCIKYGEATLYCAKAITIQVVFGILILGSIITFTFFLIKPYLSDEWVQNKIHKSMADSLDKIQFDKNQKLQAELDELKKDD